MAIQGIALPFPHVRVARPPRRAARLAARAAVAAAVALGAALAAVTVGPRVLPYEALPVLTGSMEPALPTGALAVVVRVRGDQVGVGDVITFTHPLRPSAYVTHRVAAIEEGPSGRAFVTRGDANALPDEWRVSGDGQGWRLAFAVPGVGGMLVAFATSAFRLLLLAAAMVALAVLALVEIWRPRDIHREARAA